MSSTPADWRKAYEISLFFPYNGYDGIWCACAHACFMCGFGKHTALGRAGSGFLIL